MPHRIHGRISGQINLLHQQLATAEGLPFAPLLKREVVQQVLGDENVSFRDRLYSPLVTVWVFLSQVMDACPCCLQAVARFLAYRLSQGLSPCSTATGAYCQARQRLPEGVLARLMRLIGRNLHDGEQPAAWLWKGRSVKIVDGSTLSMPDTPENQAAYPQPSSQKPGVGFPLVRLVVLFSLSVGTALDAALGKYQGKQTGETALFRTLHDNLAANDILLADRYYCSYFEIALALERGTDVVFRLHQRRRVDFRRGRRLGKDDHVVVWTKPSRPTWMDEATYARLPDSLTLRGMRVRVPQRGFRTKVVVVATSLLDAEEYRKTDIEELYRARWHAELDLRSLKVTLGMDVLRCKSPDMVRKEVWAHLLAYNLIRTLMAQAAEKHGVLPRELSFKSALELMTAFAPYLANAAAADLDTWHVHLLAAIARHRVGDRPDRYEPRARKRRPKPYPWLKEPRSKAKARLVNGSCD